MSTFKLVPADPVPSDIDVSQSITPINIATIAANAGILPDELEPYGKYKAKVSLGVRDRLKGQKVGREEKWGKGKEQGGWLVGVQSMCYVTILWTRREGETFPPTFFSLPFISQPWPSAVRHVSNQLLWGMARTPPTCIRISVRPRLSIPSLHHSLIPPSFLTRTGTT